MRVYPVIPLVVLRIVSAPIVRVSPAQSIPNAEQAATVADSFFRAVEEERWRDAAHLVDLDAFAAFRDQTVRNARHMRVHRVTAAQLMKYNPKMPRAVAEYQAAESNAQLGKVNLLNREYANVPTADSLAALPVDEAAARWIQALDPHFRMRRSFEESLGQCAVPDSLLKGMLLPSITYHVLGTVVRDSLAYVVYVDSTVFHEPPDSTTGRGDKSTPEEKGWYTMPPPVMTLRRVGDRWRIAPGELFGGFTGFASIDCSRATRASGGPAHHSH